MSNQKGLAPILIVLLVAVAIGVYFIYQKQSTPVQQSTDTNSDQFYKDLKVSLQKAFEK